MSAITRRHAHHCRYSNIIVSGIHTITLHINVWPRATRSSETRVEKYVEKETCVDRVFPDW